MIWACQTKAMDMALITMRQTINAAPRCDSRISLRKTRRIHSMVGVLLVLPSESTGTRRLPGIRAIAAPHRGHHGRPPIVQKTGHLHANEASLLSDAQIELC